MLLPPDQGRSRLDYQVSGSYIVGTTGGAALTGMVGWALSGFAAPLPGLVRAAAIGTGAILIWLCERGPLRGTFRLPEARRQIPAELFGRGLVRGAFLFGFELGTGVRTYLPSPAPYILLLTVLLGHLTLGCALGVVVGFGAGRAAPLLIQLFSTDRTRFTSIFFRGVTDVAPTATSFVVLAGALSLV